MYFVEMFMCGADVVLVMKSTLCMGHKPRECQRGVLHAPSVFRVGVALVVVKVNVFQFGIFYRVRSLVLVDTTNSVYDVGLGVKVGGGHGVGVGVHGMA